MYESTAIWPVTSESAQTGAAVRPRQALLPDERHLVGFLREPLPGEAVVIGHPHRQTFYLFLRHLWLPGTALFCDFTAAERADDAPLRPRRLGLYVSGPGREAGGKYALRQNHALVNCGLCFIFQEAPHFLLSQGSHRGPRLF